MGGRLATYEDSGKVFLWRGVPSVRGRRYPALQKLDTSSLLPATEHGLGLARKEVRPVGR
jgi:hypothetical protein